MEDILLPLAIDDIEVGSGRREINKTAVNKLAHSIEEIGLRHPVTVRRKGEKYLLIAGQHRIEAFKKLGREHIPACIVSMTNANARKWEIAENLHRAELTRLERDELVAEWVKLTEEEVSTQSVSKPQGGRPEAGMKAAARELGIDREDARRAVHVASISDEAKEAAREAGLDDNRSKLLQVAAEPPERQVATVHRLARSPRADEPLNDFEAQEKQVAALMAAWNRASKPAREEFLSRIEQPVMGREWGS